ncbi:MAG: hypothetical protein BWY26_01088 [Elusimicrobia bacterium ADurb.Bin231]|nr:MAG: hypothetical protein BWY26_01088 [Elusimicrobia bacterium ADurb.Bin231]
MMHRCQKAGLPKPEFKIDGGSFVLKVWRKRLEKGKDMWEASSRHQVGTKLALSQYQVEILRSSDTDKEITKLMAIAQRTDRTKFRNQVLNPLIEEGLLEMAIPDKPRSSKQRYRITKKGTKFLKKYDKQK